MDEDHEEGQTTEGSYIWAEEVNRLSQLQYLDYTENRILTQGFMTSRHLNKEKKYLSLGK